MEKLIECLTIALKGINEFLEGEQPTTIKERLNSLLVDGNFGTRYTRCRFKKKVIPFLNVKGLICKELKKIVLIGEQDSNSEKICRARRYSIIFVKNKHSVKQLEKKLVNNEWL